MWQDQNSEMRRCLNGEVRKLGITGLNSTAEQHDVYLAWHDLTPSQDHFDCNTEVELEARRQEGHWEKS
jgi:hypothetical protein